MTLPSVVGRDSFDDELELIKQFDDIDVTNHKKVVKRARLLRNTMPMSVIRVSLINNILNSAKPGDYLQHCRDRLSDVIEIMDQFIADGKHGMIIFKKEVFPVQLKVLPNWLEKPWHPDDELEIMRNAARGWMKDNGKTTFRGKVVLFSDFGFSGVPRLILE